MDSATADRLLELNRRFYTDRGVDFSETRLRVQPGIRRVLDTLDGGESILDLGCGNGAFARELSRRGHRGPYLGLDSSGPLLEAARTAKYEFPVTFVQADLPSWEPARVASNGAPAPTRSDQPSREDVTDWSIITAFAVLHHIPGAEARLALLSRLRTWIRPDGRFIHSNWQFSSNERLRARIQPWSSIDVDPDRLEPRDYLLDWRRGGRSLRYVHEFDEQELRDLATTCRFVVLETFYSDGADRRTSLYQFWRPA